MAEVSEELTSECRNQAGKAVFQLIVKRKMLQSGLGLGLGLLGFWFGASPGLAAPLQDSPKALVDEAWQFLNQYYIDPKFNEQDWQSLRTDLLSRNYSSPDQAYATIQQTLATLGDPYTRFLPPREYSQLMRQTQGEQVDVGLVLQEDGDILQVAAIVPQSLATKANVKVGDEIVTINGRSTDRLTLERAQTLMKGPAGSAVKLSVKRGSEKPFMVEIKREGKIDPTVQYQTFSLAGTPVGYIRLSGFNSTSSQDMAAAVQALKKSKVQGFILDLRYNPGGLLDAGIDIARQWLPSGVIVRIRQQQDEPQEVRANQTALTNLPLVILVNNNSASASEILAGALQDQKRALVVGTHTFGKARVQAVHEMSDGSALVVTVARYLTPSGRDIAQQGIIPDVIVPESPGIDQELRLNPQAIPSPRDPIVAKSLELLATQIQTPLVVR
ncbi:S41 family peptidase [Synechococcus sp. PCC 6312]|uniref:S41 family peptidase n=1 Tax=Synechococcus sp. (strain ATCC 27167 / PCC 6312) TaxID=195253 RepID=UPI00029EE44D|nr:S41 family peptidase [Synechococcus sp. PCC 6312]AFY59517.1 C-terminal processing peptidase [Synechococcus sp. PCC 6312]